MEYRVLDFLDLCKDADLNLYDIEVVLAAWGDGDGVRFPWEGGFLLEMADSSYKVIIREDGEVNSIDYENYPDLPVDYSTVHKPVDLQSFIKDGCPEDQVLYY